MIVDCDLSIANVHDSEFQDLVKRQSESLQLVDGGFYSKEGDTQNMKVCKSGKKNERMLVEIVLSMMSRYFELRDKFLIEYWNA